jgi:hypothetical protein
MNPDRRTLLLVRPWLRTLAVLGALSALAVALPACPKMKMKKRAEYDAMLWTAEVNENVERLFQQLRHHWQRAREKSTYRFPEAAPTPAAIPCGRSPQGAEPGLWQASGWKALGFSIGEAVRFQYRVISVGEGPTAGFTIRAHADLDCDGVYSTYERTGQLDGKGNLRDGLLSWDKEKELE